MSTDPVDRRKPCTCDGEGRGPGRECVVKRGQRLGELWRCSEGREHTNHAPAAAPSAPAPVDWLSWLQQFPADLIPQVSAYAAAREAAATAALRAELDLRRKSGSAVDRLHNLCEGIAESADGSEWSREEWERIDAENAELRAAVERVRGVLRRVVEAYDRHQSTRAPALSHARLHHEVEAARAELGEWR